MKALLGLLIVLGLSSVGAANAKEELVVLCERVDGGAFLALWKSLQSGTYSVATSGALDLGLTEVQVKVGRITLLAERIWLPIEIPQGRHLVEIDQAEFNCVY